jgi:multidrug efflux pump subunit AcrA (membrane-fusion protein)
LVKLAAIVLLLAAPVGVLVWLRLGVDDEIDATARDTAPVLAAAEPRTILDQRPAGALLTATEGRPLRAPAWSGTVTSVAVAQGDTVTSGTRLLTVDGVARLAVASEAPFYRPLALDDEGPDVVELHRVLVALGYLEETPDDPEVFSEGTEAAVEALEEALGIVEPTGVFDPGWFAWLPADPFVIGTLDHEPGAPAPPPGSVIAREPLSVSRAELVSQNPAEPLTLDAAVAWVFVVREQRFAVDAAALTVAAEELAALAALVEPGAERVDGVVQRAEALEVLAVPSTAVQAGANGGLCVWLPEGGAYRAVEVTVAGARAGVTNVRTGLSPGQEVLANPADVLEAPGCPSN